MASASERFGRPAPRQRPAWQRKVRGAAKRFGLSRARVASIRMCCERNVISFAPGGGGPRSRILCYHSVGTEQWGVNDVSPDRFRRQIELALERGYRFVPADLIAAEGNADKRLAITFDDGLRSVATNAAPILKEFGIPWTLFVVSAWSDGRHPFGDDIFLGWREIEQLAEDGAIIGSHSVTHPRFSLISSGEAEDEIFRSREVIASRIGITPATFAIPMGQSRDWPAAAHAAALRAGYRFVYAQSEEPRAPGTIARTFVSRFDNDRVFAAALDGKFDRWEEWV